MPNVISLGQSAGPLPLLRARRNRRPAASFPNGKPIRRLLMEDIKQQTSSAARAVGEAVGHKAEEVADRSRQAGAEGVARAAHTAEAVADAVAADAPAVAEYVRGAAAKIDRLAGDLREKKVGELLSSAAEFGRSQPLAMLAGAALVGFALSRVIKAGVAAPAASAAAKEPAPEYEPMKDLS
jgi:hypothetical protein